MKIAVLVSKNSWFNEYIKSFKDKIEHLTSYSIDIYTSHNDFKMSYDIVLFLSYFAIVPNSFLKRNKHNLVIHESDLPKGKGWAPLFWQVIEGKSKIPVVLFEACEEIDAGDIYFKDEIILDGNELNDELRRKQVNVMFNLCLKFIQDYPNNKSLKQTGNDSFYQKRTEIDSELDIDRTIRDQFNLLRTVNNDEYPAFFFYNGIKYKIKISKF